MPNTRIRDQWEPLVKSIVADNPKWGPRRILGELRNRAETQGLSSDYPSERTIQRIKDDITPEERIEYCSFSWPSSMEQGHLPWEASASALELLHHCDSLRQWRGVRPSIRLVKWFWRVSQAAPGSPLEERIDATIGLTFGEVSKGHFLYRAVEGRLAYRPWESKARMAGYKAAVERDEHPIPYQGKELDDEVMAIPVNAWPDLFVRKGETSG